MDALLSIISGLIAALVVYLLANAVKGETRKRGNRHWVEFGSAYKVLSTAFFPVSAFVTYAALQASPDQKTMAAIIAVGFWVMTLYLAYGFFFVHLSYDDDFIYHRTPLRGAHRVPWNAIKAVSYSPATQVFALTTAGYSDILVSPLANGHLAFIEKVNAQIESGNDPQNTEQA